MRRLSPLQIAVILACIVVALSIVRAISRASTAAKDVAALGAGTGFFDDGVNLANEVPLIMPHMAVVLRESSVTKSLSSDQADGLGLGDKGLEAAKGHEFVLLKLDNREAPFKPRASERPQVQIATRYGTQDVPLSGSSRNIFGPFAAVSVPIDSPVTMRITDEGKTASLDVRTGERSEQTMTDSTGAYYQGIQRTESSSDQTYQWSRQIKESLGFYFTRRLADRSRVKVDLVRAWLSADVRSEAWLPRVGWVEPGRGFLTISDIGLRALREPSGCRRITYNVSSVLKLNPNIPISRKGKGTLDKAAQLPAFTDAREKDGVITLDTAAFDIPLDTAAAELWFTPRVIAAKGCTMVGPPPRPQSIFMVLD